MSAGLAASTLTPGMTAPDVSFTTPAMMPVWATASAGRNNKPQAMETTRLERPSNILTSSRSDDGQRGDEQMARAANSSERSTSKKTRKKRRYERRAGQ